MILLLLIGFSFGQPEADFFCGPGFYPKNEIPDFSGATKFTKCVSVSDVVPTEEQCTPVFTSGMYADLNTSFNWGGTQWKDGRCQANDCPSVSDHFIAVPKDVFDNSNLFKACNKLGCVTDFKGRKCFSMTIITLIIIVAVCFVGLVVVGIVLCTICCCFCKRKTPPERVEVAIVGLPGLNYVPLESGAYVVLKLGSQEHQTKKVINGPRLNWAQTIEFIGLSAEDDDVSFQLKNDADLIGSGDLRLVEYVNKKMGVSVVLKDSVGADVGVLEIDVEVQVDETLAVPEIKAVFFMNKYTDGKVEDNGIQVLEEPVDI